MNTTLLQKLRDKSHQRQGESKKECQNREAMEKDEKVGSFEIIYVNTDERLNKHRNYGYI